MSVLFVIIFHNPMFLFFMFYKEGISGWVSWVHWAMKLFPAFNFSVAWGIVSRITGSHFLSNEFRWENGREMVFDDLTLEMSG